MVEVESESRVKKRRRIIGIGILVGIIAVAWTLLPRPKKLIWYTTPPYKLPSSTLRVKLLVPRDYELASARWTTGIDTVSLGLEPSQKLSWLPERIRDLFHLESRQSGISFLLVDAIPQDKTVNIMGGMSEYSRIRTLAGNPGVCLQYWTQNKGDFDSDCVAILMSAKVIRVSEKESGK